MKRTSKTYLTGTSIAAFAFFLNTGIASADCPAAPSCAEMGYTSTSCNADETGLRCPFDMNKYKCVDGCDTSKYSLSTCPESSLCLKCGGKYKVVGCRSGYITSVTDGTVECKEYAACPSGYISENQSCPQGAVCSDTELCKTASETYRRIYCYGEQKGWTHYNAGTGQCESSLSRGARVQLSCYAYGIVLNTYTTTSGIVKADIAMFTREACYDESQVPYSIYMVTTNNDLNGANTNYNCFGTMQATEDDAKAAQTQHENSCGLGRLTTWDTVVGWAANQGPKLTGDYEVIFHLPNVYELTQMMKLDLLPSYEFYWASMVKSASTVQDGITTATRWGVEYAGKRQMMSDVHHFIYPTAVGIDGQDKPTSAYSVLAGTLTLSTQVDWPSN